VAPALSPCIFFHCGRIKRATIVSEFRSPAGSNTPDPILSWWQATWRAAIWLIIIVLVYALVSDFDDTGQIGVLTTIGLFVGSGFFHKSLRVPVLIIPSLIVCCFLLAAAIAGGLSHFR
jgi:hypothetical protein